MKIYENKILRILGFIFIWIYVFGVGICFAGRWYAIGIPGVVLLLVCTTVQRNYPIGSVDLNRNHSSDVLV